MSKSISSKRSRCFTLVEIMFVMLVIGILLTIAFPSYLRARSGARGKACRANLKQIEGAKSQWAMDSSAPPTATPTASNLYGAGKYIRSTPECPTSGTYTIANLGADPTCSIGNNGTATEAYDDHILP